MYRARMHAQPLAQLLKGEVQLQACPVQLTQFAYHEDNLRFASPDVKHENEKISGEGNGALGLRLRQMDRLWLLALLKDLREKAGSDLAFAKIVGYRHSGHVPKLLNDEGPMPNVSTCLRIAQAAHAHPSDVLRAAGHDDVIPLLESVYAAARDLPRHTLVAPSADADAAASREIALAQLQDAARAIATAAAALHQEPTTARRHAPAHPRVHRPAS